MAHSKVSPNKSLLRAGGIEAVGKVRVEKAIYHYLRSGDTRRALPVVEMTLIHYRRLMEAGFADEDISALFREKRRLFDNNGDHPKKS